MRSYNIILVNLNSIPGLDFYPVYPIGATYVYTYLKQIGTNVRFIDFNLTPKAFETLEFLNSEFDCIAFSLRNIDSMELNGEFWLPYYREVMERIVQQAKSKNPSTMILLGGGGYSVYSEGLDGVLPFDFGIKGNVEEDLFLVIKEHVQRLDDDIYLVEDYSMFDICFESELVKTYLEMGAIQIGVPTRCGGRCPMKCMYCSYGKIDNKTNLTRPLTNLRNDIVNLYEMGVREIFFTDSLFNISLSHAKSICRMIIELNLPDFKWSAYAKPTTDAEFIELAARSGCKSLMVSFDTFSPQMLNRLRKGFNQQQAITFIQLCREWDVSLIGLMLFGGPDEDEVSVKETCQVINQYFKKGELFFSFGMRLLPGSELAVISRIPEKEMIYPLFWSFDEACFDYVIRHLDKRFLGFKVLARVSNWRKSYDEMQLFQFPDVDTPVLKRPVSL